MTESGTASARLGPSPTHVHHDRHRAGHRRCLHCCLISLLILIALIITAVIIAVTVFKPRDPRTTLISAAVSGISPRVPLPPFGIDLNITLDLELLVRNPNYASFTHERGTSRLLYHGAQVGESDVAAGRIPSRGSEHVRASLTVDGGQLTAEVGRLIRDVMAGEVGLDTTTVIPGKVTFLGFIESHAVATSECHVAVGLMPEVKITSQECRQRTKL